MDGLRSMKYCIPCRRRLGAAPLFSAASWLVLAALLAPRGAPAQSPGGGFERYLIILERQPFGVEAVPPPPPPPSQALPADSFVNYMKMTAVIRDDAGQLRVGLVNTKTKRDYLVGIGDAVDGVEVVDANYENEKARLRKESEDYWISMKGATTTI